MSIYESMSIHQFVPAYNPAELGEVDARDWPKSQINETRTFLQMNPATEELLGTEFPIDRGTFSLEDTAVRTPR